MNLEQLKHRNDIAINRPKCDTVEDQETVSEWMTRTGKRPEQIPLGKSSMQDLIDKRYGK